MLLWETNFPEGPNFSKTESFQDLLKEPLHLCKVWKCVAVISACNTVGVDCSFFSLECLTSLYFFLWLAEATVHFSFSSPQIMSLP